MKAKYLLLLSVIVCASWVPSIGYAVDAGGVWESKVMGAKIRAYVQQNGTQLSGVAKVRPSGGKSSTYHFQGSINGDKVYVAHHKGHTFSGTLQGQRRMVGTLTTGSGYSVPVTATRK